MLPYFEQGPMFNAINFSVGTSAAAANLTIAGVRVASLICPSDLQNDTIPMPASRGSLGGVTPGWSWNEVYPLPAGSWTQAFTGYAGNAGTFTFGYTNLMPSTVLAQFNGVIYDDSAVRIAAITDGEGDALVTPPGPALFKTGDVDGTLIVQLDGVNKSISLGVR